MALQIVSLDLHAIADALSSRVRTRSLYRVHQLSVWLRLVPKLHAAGASDIFPQVRKSDRPN